MSTSKAAGRGAATVRTPAAARPLPGLSVERRYRYLYKPAVFLACLAPLAWMAASLFGWFGLSPPVDAVKFLELRCGKTALNLLLLTLMVTPVRQIIRLPHLLRLRRMLGLFAFFYAALHFTVYLVLDVDLDWHQLAADLLKRPYITVGFSALLLLLPLAITSTNRMMRRLGRRWSRLHRLIYLIAALGVWHFYWQEKIDVREPLVYAGILLLLLGYRWVRSPRTWAVLAPLRSPSRPLGSPAEQACGQQQQRAQKLEYAVDYDTEQAQRQEQQPEDRPGEQRQHRDRPAQHEQDQPQQHLDHRLTLPPPVPRHKRGCARAALLPAGPAEGSCSPPR